VTLINPTAATAVTIFFWLIAIVFFVVEAFAFIDAIRRPAGSYVAAGKQTKPLWLLILGVATVIGLGGALGFLTLLSILPIVAFVAAGIYMADVRPKVRAIGGGGSQHQGPYGPW
jgi:hypothetical protein